MFGNRRAHVRNKLKHFIWHLYEMKIWGLWERLRVYLAREYQDMFTLKRTIKVHWCCTLLWNSPSFATNGLMHLQTSDDHYSLIVAVTVDRFNLSKGLKELHMPRLKGMYLVDQLTGSHV